jgi:hypothetical protein
LKALKAFLLLAGFACAAAAQDTPCFIQLNDVSAPTTIQFDNSNPQCTSWTMAWTSTGFSAASVQFESAPDSAGSPGTWVAFAGTVVSGLNPSTIANTGQQATVRFFGYQPWVRINFQSKTGTGTIHVIAFGFSPQPSDPSTATILLNSGGGTITDYVSDHQTAFSLSSATDVVIATGAASTTTRITKFDVAWDNAATITVRAGTGSTCGTNTVTIAGPYGNANLVALFEDYGVASALRNTVQGDDICLHFSTAVTGGGGAAYAQF